MLLTIIAGLWIACGVRPAVYYFNQIGKPDPAYGEEPEAVPGELGNILAVPLMLALGPIALGLFLIPNSWFEGDK